MLSFSIETFNKRNGDLKLEAYFCICLEKVFICVWSMVEIQVQFILVTTSEGGILTSSDIFLVDVVDLCDNAGDITALLTTKML